MKLPWQKIMRAAREGARILQRQQAEKPRLRQCPVDGTALVNVHLDLQICARGHRFGPNEARGELGNQGDVHGEI